MTVRRPETVDALERAAVALEFLLPTFAHLLDPEQKAVIENTLDRVHAAIAKETA